LRWEDQLKIKKDIGEKIEDNETEKRREKVVILLRRSNAGVGKQSSLGTD
jgi:hypothetical protein